MQFEIGIAAQGQKVVVVIGRRDGCDGDIGGLRLTGRHELPRPAHRLDGLVIGGGRADDRNLWPLQFLPHDPDDIAVEPLRNGPGPGDPAHRHLPGNPVQQGPPYGGELGDADDFDRTEERRDMIQTLKPRLREVDGAHRRRRQGVQDRLFESGHRSKAGMSGGPGLKVEARTPRLAQGVGGGVHHAGKVLDTVEFSEFRVRQHGPDRLPEGVVVDRPGQTAGQSRRQLLERHDLQAVPAVACGGETKLAHRQPVVGDDRPALCRCLHRDKPFRCSGRLAAAPLIATPAFRTRSSPSLRPRHS